MRSEEAKAPEFGCFVRAKAPITWNDSYGKPRVAPEGAWGGFGGTWVCFYGIGVVPISSVDVLEIVPKDEYPPEGWSPYSLPLVGKMDLAKGSIGRP